MNTKDATRTLRDEHRLILHVLDSFEITLGRWEQAGAAHPGQGVAFLAFLREFSDGCHHRKEEELLFPSLADLHLDPDHGPVAQVLAEHDRMRVLARGIAAHVDAAEAGDAAALGALLSKGRELTDVLRRHIDKEEHCLFGMADDAIRGDDLARLTVSYHALESAPEFRRRYEHGRHLAADLTAERGPLPAVRPAGAPSSAAPRADAAARPFASAVTVEPWQLYRTPLLPDPGTELAVQCARALTSEPVNLLRQALARIGRRISPDPMLWKRLPGGLLRLFFPVFGEPDHIEPATVVAIVLLHEIANERTLYAHPVYAGPEANPLLKHVGGPMSRPRAQAGENGVSATRRLLHQKISIWEAFERERSRLGPEEATRRWRARYAWSLVRLYFCERCSACRWGSPYFEGDGGTAFRAGARLADDAGARRKGEEWASAAAAIRSSAAWQIEAAYARRGGFALGEDARLGARLAGDWTLVIFPTDAEILDGGSIVAAAAYYHEPTRETRWVQCLSAGAEAETVFLAGDGALGLPLPGDPQGRERQRYAEWRRQAWTAFWLDELELGVHAASTRWLDHYWAALRTLVRATA